jgi:16S rRNA A1518/A1519 N6-dimethyltransferase RsmA/KsgA/DIM1 with predicted DNA glycosylase/AP lyase activity
MTELTRIKNITITHCIYYPPRKVEALINRLKRKKSRQHAWTFVGFLKHKFPFTRKYLTGQLKAMWTQTEDLHGDAERRLRSDSR